ncbi:MAG: NAD-dependent epimerase/dehydratase family protein [Solirubrobacterales bacterium]|nr:NAD-dependent epimerase/dehydratase family protein [Solirubrobacterales bacterium]
MAVTGPTGDIGRSLLRALEREPGVGRVVAMARRAFDPSELGLSRTEYRRGDVLDKVAVDELVAGADVVIHLAFLILGGREETEQVNLDGSRTVFEAAVAAGASRLVYASSVAAYGFHADNPSLLTEDLPLRGTERHYYSAQKAHLESALHEVVSDSATQPYVFRPSIVAGPDALALLQNIPYLQLAELVRRYQNPLTAALLEAVQRFPNLRPVLPDPGTRFQLVHHDDVAGAFTAAVLGRGEPGVYNLAGPGDLRVSDLARELGWYSLPVPRTALDSLAELVARLPLVPAQAQWIETLRQSVLMDTTKARRELDWEPRHDARETLQEMVQAARERGLLDLA